MYSLSTNIRTTGRNTELYENVTIMIDYLNYVNHMFINNTFNLNSNDSVSWVRLHLSVYALSTNRLWNCYSGTINIELICLLQC